MRRYLGYRLLGIIPILVLAAALLFIPQGIPTVQADNRHAETVDCSISGHIQTESGTAISGVTVSDGNGHSATTNASGDYTISGLTPGSYTITPSLTCYSFDPTSRSLTLTGDTSLDFTGTPNCSVSGHIQTDSGAPISGVTVSDDNGHSAITDASGDYTISGLTAGSSTITPSLPCYSFVPTSRTLTLPGAASQDFTGTANCTISGHIQNGSGTAISGVTVSDGNGHSAITDASGNYTISGLTAGSYTISASRTGYIFSPDSRAVTLPPNSSGQDFTGTSDYTLSGHVQDGDGNPISGVTISDGAGHSAITNALGDYSIVGIPAGTYTVTPSNTYYTFSPISRSVTLPPNAVNIDFTAILLPAPAPTLVTPAEGETVDTFTPTYTWNVAPTAVQYSLYIGSPDGMMIFSQWYNATEVCSGSTCVVKPAQNINPGQNRWCVKSNNASGGAWSTCNVFNSPAPAGKPVLLSPIGGIKTPTFYPTYEWSDIPEASFFKLEVYNAGGVQVFSQWFSRGELTCSGGTCSTCPDTALGTGSHTWAVKSYNTIGGTWSDPATFKTPTTAVIGAVLIAPTGTVSGINPTFQWTGEIIATYYKIYVLDKNGVIVHDQWYRPKEVNCKNGTACSKTVTLILPAGNYTWYVRAYNPVGIRAWSLGMAFIAE